MQALAASCKTSGNQLTFPQFLAEKAAVSKRARLLWHGGKSWRHRQNRHPAQSCPSGSSAPTRTPAPRAGCSWHICSHKRSTQNAASLGVLTAQKLFIQVKL